MFFDMMAIRLDPAKAAGQSMVINWHFTDRDEKLVLTLSHCTLSHRLGEWSDAAAASVTTTRATLDADAFWASSPRRKRWRRARSEVEGDASRLAALFAMLDQPAGLDVRHPHAG